MKIELPVDIFILDDYIVPSGEANNKRPSGRTVAIFIDAEKAFDLCWHSGMKKMFYDAKLPINIIAALKFS